MFKQITWFKKYSSSTYFPAFFYLLCYCAIAAIAPAYGFYGDRDCWVSWSSAIFKDGLGNVYSSGTNYLPLYHYFLLIYGNIQGSVDAIQNNIYSLKYITLIFDVVGVYLIFLLVNDKLKKTTLSILLTLLILFNIAYLYNTVIWAQVDAIFTAFIFLAFYFSLKNKILLSSIFLVLAVNMKLQAIIYLPFIALIMLPTIVKKITFKSFLLWMGAIVILQVAILLPFILKGELDKVIEVAVNSMGAYPVVSLNAYNIWCWLLDGNLMYIPDTNTFLEFSYNNWGLLIFSILYLITLFPLIRNSVFLLSNKYTIPIHLNKLLIMGVLIPLIFFFFNTQMHERYSHPMFLFVGAYSILNRNYFVYALLSTAYFFNLENLLNYFEMKDSFGILFHPKFVSTLYFIAIVFLFMTLYKKDKIAPLDVI